MTTSLSIFVEEGHVYTVRGQIIERSTTGVMGPYFPYNPVAITDRFYESWASPKDPAKLSERQVDFFYLSELRAPVLQALGYLKWIWY